MKKNVQRFFVFLGFTLLTFFLALSNFEFYIFFLATVLIGLLAALTGFLPKIGHAGHVIGSDNNYPLFIWAGMTLFFVIAGIFYGPGEPIFIGTWRDSVEWARPHYTEDRQKIVNSTLFGFDKTENQMSREISFIRSLGIEGKYPLKKSSELMGDERGKYNMSLRNWSAYGLFASDEEIQQILSLMPKNQKPKEIDQPDRETWLFWRLAIAFFILTLARIPFSFADEVADLFSWVANTVRTRNRDFQTKYHPSSGAATQQPAQQPPQPATGATGSGTGTTSPPRSGILYRWSSFFTSNMAAEFLIRLLESLGRLFRRI